MTRLEQLPPLGRCDIGRQIPVEGQGVVAHPGMRQDLFLGAGRIVLPAIASNASRAWARFLRLTISSTRASRSVCLPNTSTWPTIRGTVSAVRPVRAFGLRTVEQREISLGGWLGSRRPTSANHPALPAIAGGRSTGPADLRSADRIVDLHQIGHLGPVAVEQLGHRLGFDRVVERNLAAGQYCRQAATAAAFWPARFAGWPDCGKSPASDRPVRPKRPTRRRPPASGRPGPWPSPLRSCLATGPRPELRSIADRLSTSSGISAEPCSCMISRSTCSSLPPEKLNCNIQWAPAAANSSDAEQRDADDRQGVVNLQRQLIAGLDDRLLQQPHRAGRVVPARPTPPGPPRRPGCRDAFPETGRPWRPLVRRFAQIGLQGKLGRQQAGPIGIFLRQLVDQFQGGDTLLPFDHPLELFQLRHEFGATEFDLLASAAGTRRVGIENHDLFRTDGMGIGAAEPVPPAVPIFSLLGMNDGSTARSRLPTAGEGLRETRRQAWAIAASDRRGTAKCKGSFYRAADNEPRFSAISLSRPFADRRTS